LLHLGNTRSTSNRMEFHSSRRPPSSSILLDDFTIEKEFAVGTSSQIFLAHQKSTGEKVIVKKILKATTPRERIRKEVEAGRRLGDHPNIVKLRNHFEDEDAHYVTMDFISGMDLMNVFEQRNMQPIEEHLAKLLFRGLVSALVHSHKKGVIHKDIKLENVMITTDGKVMLIDFGLCELVSCDDGNGNYNVSAQSMCSDWGGTIEYVAPEILIHTPFVPQLADVWSLGVLLYCVVFGKFPFVHQSRVDHLLKTIEQLDSTSQLTYYHPPVVFPSKSNVSDSLKLLLQQMLVADPAKRICLEKVAHHPWFTDCAAVSRTSSSGSTGTVRDYAVERMSQSANE